MSTVNQTKGKQTMYIGKDTGPITETMEVKTTDDFSTLKPEERYRELAARLVELKDARSELQDFKDDKTGDADVPWDSEIDGFKDDKEEEKYRNLVMNEDEKWCRVREMVRDALSNDILWQC